MRPNPLLKDVKLLLNLEQENHDELLELLIQDTTDQLLLLTEDLTGLDFIIREVSVKKFRKIGNEGLKSSSLDVVKMEFEEDFFQPYMSFIKPRGEGSYGTVRFL